MSDALAAPAVASFSIQDCENQRLALLAEDKKQLRPPEEIMQDLHLLIQKVELVVQQNILPEAENLLLPCLLYEMKSHYYALHRQIEDEPCGWASR